MRFGGRVGDELDKLGKQLLLPHLIEICFVFLELQESFVALDLERHAGRFETCLHTVCFKPCI